MSTREQTHTRGSLDSITARPGDEQRSHAEGRSPRTELVESAELEGMELLADLSARLVSEGDIQVLYDEILGAAITLAHADAGTVQILDRHSQQLVLIVTRGFDRRMTDHFRFVDARSHTSCGIALATGQRTFVDFDVDEHDDPDGSLRMHVEAGYLSAQSTPLVSRSGKSIGMLSTHWRDHRRPSGGELRFLDLLARQAADLIERKLGEDALRESEERQRLIVESVTDHAIVTLSVDGRIGSWNRAAERLFGFRREEALGQHTSIIFTPEDRAAGEPEQEMQRARVAGRSDDDRWHVKKSGERLFVSGVLAPLRSGGVLTGYVKIARDLTERKQLEEDLRRAHAEAERASRAKDEFLAMLGHELRNPLAPMLTALQLMRLRGIESREQEVLERQVAHLTRMVDDLLDVSRITRGKIQLRKRLVELRDVVARAMEMARPILEQRGNRVEAHLTGPGVIVDADLDRMAQVVFNLLTNATKYSAPGSAIVLRAERDGDMARIVVRDEGIGIAPELIDSVFDAFVQHPQSIERSGGGLGLGLAIVQSLVAAHGGEVRAASAGRHQGSTFTVELPAVNATAIAAEPQARTIRRRVTPSGTRVLVVDDNYDAVQTLGDALRERGYDVEVAFDGASALARARVFRPALILLDIGLPLMDGYEVARRLRAMPPSAEPLRLFALTGYGQDTDRQRALDAGFERHLVKPVDLHELEALIDSPAGS